MNATFPTSPFPLGPELSPSKPRGRGSGGRGLCPKPGPRAVRGPPKPTLPQPRRGGAVQAKAVLKTDPEWPSAQPRAASGPATRRHEHSVTVVGTGRSPLSKPRAPPLHGGKLRGGTKDITNRIRRSRHSSSPRPPLAFPISAIPSYYQMRTP